MRTAYRVCVAQVLMGLLVGLLCGQAQAGAVDVGRIERAIKMASSAGMQVGFHAVQLTSGDVVSSWRGDEPMIPASNVKLAVTAAAIELLGPDYAFETRLVRLGNDLVIVGGGDPSLGDPRMCEARGEAITAVFERWADVLRQRGLAQVAGDLVIDDSLFEPQWVHPNWPDGEHARWYRAPVTGLNFNDNCVEVTVAPAAKAGALAIITLTPPAPHFTVTNKCKTGNGGRTPVVWRAPDEDRLVISGHCSKQVQLQSAAVSDPGMLTGWACKTVLAEHGVAVAGSVVRRRVRTANGSLPAGAEVIAVHRTPLADVIMRCNKYSQNLFAECLTKAIGLKASGVGSWQAGCVAVDGLLSRIGVADGACQLEDGSGLSRGNRLTARSLESILGWLYRHKHGQLVIDSLPIAGVDGSLERRMRDPALRGKIQAKTGSLDGVSALSGYADGPDGPIVFSMIFNNTAGHGGLVKKTREQICRALVGAPEVAQRSATRR